MARIHRDGGHYQAEHGTEKAAKDADLIVADLNALKDAKPETAGQDDRDKLLTIIGYAYQIAGAHDVPEHILDVLADPEAATIEQVGAMLPYVPAGKVELTDEEMLDCLKSVDPETQRLPLGFKQFARAILSAANIKAGEDAKLYRVLRSEAMDGNLEAFVAMNQLDHIRDAEKIDTAIAAAQKKGNT